MRSMGRMGGMGLLALLCAVWVVVAGAGSGCTSSAARVSYQTAATTSVTVEVAVRAYNVAAAAGRTTVEQNRQVRMAYERYQACMVVLCDAGAVYAATAGQTNAPAAAGLAQAAANVTTSIGDVIALVKAFGVTL